MNNLLKRRSATALFNPFHNQNRAKALEAKA
jgi:hypothetical protein